MKETDLKIGNLIHYKLYPNPIKVDGIFESQVEDGEMIIVSDNEEFYLTDCTEIPLTPKWLLELGFIQHPWGWVNNGILIVGKEGNYHVKLGNGCVIELPCVHTLQNLFHLTTQHG